MRKKLWSICMIGIMALSCVACGKPEQTLEEVLQQQYAGPEAGDTVAAIHVKNMGTIKVHFFPEQAPKAVENFVTHSENGYYDGVTFHRVINEFMIQGGDPEGTGAGGESIWGTDFEDECTDELLVTRGSLCMANAGPNTNGSQFFITQVHPEYTSAQYIDASVPLEAKEIYLQKGGAPWLQGQHTVFGQVYEGMEVVDAIAALDSDGQGTPAETITIDTIEISEYQE